MRVLVTGASGFAGKHLVVALLERGHRVFAGIHQSGDINKDVQPVMCDVLDQTGLDRPIEEVKPDGVYIWLHKAK